MRFKKPKNTLEGKSVYATLTVAADSQEQAFDCVKCKKPLTSDELNGELFVCPYCRHHYKMNARQRIHYLVDTGSFVEKDAGLTPRNILEFPGYDEKLEAARLQSAEKDSVVSGSCTIDGHTVELFVMEPQFMMGSMGSIAGEKITRCFERALGEDGVAHTTNVSPVVGFAVSGGARMQEGILSLMQMAKTSGAIKKHNDAGGLFVCVLTDPTTGGVTASFAMEADVIVAEPNALIGFAGPRVIEQTIRKKLPEGFQRAEFQLEHGFIDSIIDRRGQKKYLTQLLALHRGEQAQ